MGTEMRKIQGSKSRGFITLRFLLGFIFFFSLALFCGNASFEARAEGDGEMQVEKLQGKLMETVTDTAGLTLQSEKAIPIIELPEGTQVWVVGEETDGWYEIYYNGETAYVPVGDLKESTVLDAAALEQEMQKMAEEGKAFIESLELQRKAIARSKVWRTVIIVLIAAVFITGVVSALRKPKNDKDSVKIKKNTGK